MFPSPARWGQPKAFVPRVETLEDRSCPSCAVWFADGVLTVLGDSAANTIILRDRGAGSVEVSCDGDRPVGARGVTRIVVASAGGDDRVAYLMDSPDLRPSPNIRIDLGSGNDTLALQMDSPDLRSFRNLTVNGDEGRDTINVLLRNPWVARTVSDAGIRVAVNGGGDADRLSVVLQGATLIGDAVLDVTVNGDDGNDYLAVLMDDPNLIPSRETADAPRVRVRVNGGSGSDLVIVLLGASPVFRGSIDGGEGLDTALHTSPVLIRNVERDTVVRG